MRGLEWGETDYAVVVMEPMLDNTYEIELRRQLGELGSDSSVGLNFVFGVDRTPGLRGQWGTISEALDEAPAVWIARELRYEPAIAAALTEDRPVAAELRINGFAVA